MVENPGYCQYSRSHRWNPVSYEPAAVTPATASVAAVTASVAAASARRGRAVICSEAESWAEHRHRAVAAAADALLLLLHTRRYELIS